MYVMPFSVGFCRLNHSQSGTVTYQKKKKKRKRKRKARHVLVFFFLGPAGRPEVTCGECTYKLTM